MPRNMTLSKIASAMFGIRKIILVPTCHPLFFTLVSFKMYLTFLQRCSAFFSFYPPKLFCIVSCFALCPKFDEQYVIILLDVQYLIKQVKTRALKEHLQTNNNNYYYCLPSKAPSLCSCST